MGHASPAARVPVALGARSYDVLIGPGLLATVTDEIADRFGSARAAIVTDAHVRPLHHAGIECALKAAGRYLGTVELPPGEATKSIPTLARVCEELLDLGVERGDVIIALGGGVIGDLAGFAASILRRGVRFVQIPTSLLAQVDSSVGGKTGVNTRHGKNLLGAFHQPSLVIADTDVLSTLSAREKRAGYAEVVKYGLLGDALFFEWLDRHWTGLLNGNDPRVVGEAVQRSVAAKAAIVARDETETGDRMLLNLGHTFGHALEAWAGFSDRLLHGEAVAIGMAQAFRFSEAQGLCESGIAAKVEAHLVRVGLPSRISHIKGPDRPDVSTLLKLMAQDKKVKAGRLTFILVHGIGSAFVTREIEAGPLRLFLEGEVVL